MTDLSNSLIDMKSDFVCEALDLAQVHLLWTGRHLGERRHEQALIAFDRFLSAARAAAAEMKEIKAKLADHKLSVEAAVEFRSNRSPHRSGTGASA